MYADQLKAHALRPQNRISMEDPDAVGESFYKPCSDSLKFYFKLDGEKLSEVSFSGRACRPAVAVASYMTTLLRGKTVTEALAISAFQIDDLVGGLPLAKRHAYLLVLECIHDALSDQTK